MKYHKNRGDSQGGYTIIEVMIVLVVSATLFVSAAAAISQQNRRTQFSQSVQTLQQRLQDVLNDVQTGYYVSNNDTHCTAPANGGPVVISTAPTSQGTNQGCTFVGKYVQANGDRIQISTIAGRQKIGDSNSKDVEEIKEAKPVLVGTGMNEVVLDYGLRVSKILQLTDSTELSNRDFAIISSFAPSDGVGDGSKIGTRGILATVTSGVSGLDSANIDAAKDGILLCLTDGDRKATITIGGVNQGDPTVVIDSEDARCG